MKHNTVESNEMRHNYLAFVNGEMHKAYINTVSNKNKEEYKMNTYFIEFEIVESNPSMAETLLLYALGEEFMLTKKWCDNYSRISNEIIRVEIKADTRDHALLRTYNALRISKNVMAHTCAVTVIE